MKHNRILLTCMLWVTLAIGANAANHATPPVIDVVIEPIHVNDDDDSAAGANEVIDFNEVDTDSGELSKVTITLKKLLDQESVDKYGSGKIKAVITGKNYVRIWKNADRSELITLSDKTIFDKDVSIGMSQDYVKIFYLEGIEHTITKEDVIIEAGYTVDTAEIAKDTAKTGVWQVDMDVDSNNNNAFDFSGFDKAEDEIEFSQKQAQLGKVCIANNQRNPETERVPGWADGFNAAAPTEDDTLKDVQFVPVRINLEKPFDPRKTKIKFIYTASPPKSVTTAQIPNTQASNYVLPDGLGRLWKADATAKRNKESVVDDGHFIPANEFIEWGKIAQGNSADLYFECVRGSTAKESLKIEVTEGNVVCEDYVNMSFESLEALSQGYFTELNDDVFNYIEKNEKTQNKALNRLSISSDLKFKGPQTVTAALSSTVQNQDTFKPSSGSGEFKPVIKSLGTEAEQIAVRTIAADRAQIKHKMRPALYRNQFHITAYSTSNEADFNGTAVNDVGYYVKSLNHYYFIHSNVAARDSFLKDVSIEGFGVTLNNITLQAVDTPRGAPNPLPAGTNAKTRFFNMNMVQRPHPLGIANRPLVYNNSCAITRYKGTNRGQTIPDLSNIIVVGAENTTYKNRISNDTQLVGTRSCIDKVTDQLGAWHIDMYVDATKKERDRINRHAQVILK